MDPHTTQKGSRSCVECHQDPRALGLGGGNLAWDGNVWRFTSSLSSAPSLLGIDHPLDSFVNMDGAVFVNTSREGLRPFNAFELKSILRVGLCLPCHKDFSDPVMKNWVPTAPPALCGPGERALRPLKSGKPSG